MKQYLNCQKIAKRKPKRSRLATAVALLGIISLELGAIGVYILKNEDYETISEKRARYLKIANEQLMQTQDPATISGLNKVITDIENGVYDY